MKWQAIHKASWAGDHQEVERLLNAGANLNKVAPTISGKRRWVAPSSSASRLRSKLVTWKRFVCC